MLIKRDDDDAQRDRVWRSRERSAAWPDPAKVKGARKARLPKVVEPELATLVAAAPRGDDWLHEIKLDGYRMLARCDGEGGLRWLTRRGHDWSARVPSLSAELRALELPDALIDGELVVQERGISSFQHPWARFDEQRAKLTQRVLRAAGSS